MILIVINLTELKIHLKDFLDSVEANYKIWIKERNKNDFIGCI